MAFDKMRRENPDRTKIKQVQPTILPDGEITHMRVTMDNTVAINGRIPCVKQGASNVISAPPASDFLQETP